MCFVLLTQNQNLIKKEELVVQASTIRMANTS